MADPLRRWVSNLSCQTPVLHAFKGLPRRPDGTHGGFCCSRCGLRASAALVMTYVIGTGQPSSNIAPSLTMPGPDRRKPPHITATEAGL